MYQSSDEDDDTVEDFDEYIEDDYEDVSLQIQQLVEIRDAVRGKK